MAIEANDLKTLRVDQVGSLMRPDKLRETYARHQRGEATEEELRAVEDEAVREVIARQEAIRFPIVTDGESRRGLFQESFVRSSSGWGGDSPNLSVRTPVVERLRPAHNVILDEYRFAHEVATVPVKITLIGPDRITQRFDFEASRAVYASLAEFAQDVAAVEHQMIGEVIAAGCRYVQIDAPSYTAYVDPASLEQMRARGENPKENMRRSMAADNAVIAGFPGVTFSTHLCRGNTATPNRYGHYDDIAEELFNTLNFDRFLLEYDTERAGGFEPLRSMPRGKIAVLGLVSTKEREIESVDYLMQRIDEASKYLDVEQLAICPQCGFASGMGAPGARPGRMTMDEQFRKLERLLEVASRVWG